MKISEAYQYCKKSVFVRKLGDSSAGMVLDRLLAILLPFVAVKVYGTTVYGEFTYYFAIATMVSVLSQLGLPSGLIYFIPKSGNRYVSGSFLVSFVLSILVGLATALAKTDFWSYIPLLVMISLNQLFFSLHRSRQEIRSYYFMDVLLRQSVIAALLFLLSSSLVPLPILISYSTGYFVSTISMGLLNRKQFEKPRADKDLILYSLPLMFTSIMTSMMSHIDAIMIGDMIGKEAVSVYVIAAGIATAPSYMLRILNTVYAPKLSSYFANDQLEEFKRSYILTSRILGLSALVIVVVLILIDRWILGFFGPEFLMAEKVILYRGLGQVVNSGVGSAWFVISMSGKPRYNMYGTSMAALLNVFLNWWLIPILGIDGAAVASMAAVIFSNLFAYTIVKRMYHVKVYGIF